VTGAGGLLGQAIRAELERRGHDALALTHEQLDVLDAPAVEQALERLRPDATVQCAGYTRADDAELEEAAAQALNAGATATLARASARLGFRLVYPSSDYVFDGRARQPYAPSAATAPLGAYGRSKVAGERAALAAPGALVVRTAWLYGSGGRNFVRTILGQAREGRSPLVVGDQIGSPSPAAVAAGAIVGLLEGAAPGGVYHAACRGQASWFELAREAVRLAGLDVPVRSARTEEVPRRARRPAYSVLDSSATEARVGPLPDWRAALAAASAEGAW